MLKNLENIEDNSNKKRGSRLKACREYRNLSQEKLAELVNVSTNYVSMLERGVRRIDLDKAVMFAEKLNVSTAFIMCETDIMLPNRKQNTFGLDEYGNIDLSFLRFIVAAGHDLVFHVVILYDGKQLSKEEAFGDTFIDLSSLNIDTTLDNLIDVCLSDAHCKLQTGDTLSEVIIHEVTLDGVLMSFGSFAYTINRLYDYIDFTFDNIKSFNEERYAMHVQDEMIDEEIITSRNKVNGVEPSREELLKETVLQIEKGYGFGSVKLLSEDEIKKS
jgi:transcriptional regulator with XRE-family HTH domain